jgi:predicted transcriptional regulator of viral defense system
MLLGPTYYALFAPRAILELFGVATEAELQSLRNTLTNTYVPLDPTLPNEGSHLAKWRLRLNIPREELLAARST